MEERFEEMNNVEVEETNEETRKSNAGLIGLGAGLVAAGVVGGIALFRKNKGKIADKKAAKQAKALNKKIKAVTDAGFIVVKPDDCDMIEEDFQEETEE